MDWQPTTDDRSIREERAARAIAANKRGLNPLDPEIDRVWTAYLGQARACVAAYNAQINYVGSVTSNGQFTLKRVGPHYLSPARDRDGSGEAGQTAEQAGPKATARAVRHRPSAYSLTPTPRTEE